MKCFCNTDNIELKLLVKKDASQRINAGLQPASINEYL